MKSVAFFLLLLPAVIRASMSETAELNTQAQKDAILAKHNALRKAEMKDADNAVYKASLSDLVWDDALATAAVTHAEHLRDTGSSSSGCAFGHSGASENLASYFSSNPISVVDDAFVSARVQSWWDEVTDFHYMDGIFLVTDDLPPVVVNCVAGKDCGHFTQVMWNEATKLGCGLAACPLWDYSTQWSFHGIVMVCQYDKGNMKDAKIFDKA